MDETVIKILANYGIGAFTLACVCWLFVRVAQQVLPPYLAAKIKNIDANTANTEATTRMVIGLPAKLDEQARASNTRHQELLGAVRASFAEGFAAVGTALVREVGTSEKRIVEALGNERARKIDEALARLESSPRGSAPDTARAGVGLVGETAG